MRAVGAPHMGLSHCPCHWPLLQPSQYCDHARDISALVCRLWSMRGEIIKISLYKAWNVAFRHPMALTIEAPVWCKRSTSFELRQSEVSPKLHNCELLSPVWEPLIQSQTRRSYLVIPAACTCLLLPHPSLRSYSPTTWVSAYFSARPPGLCNSAPHFL